MRDGLDAAHIVSWITQLAEMRGITAPEGNFIITAFALLKEQRSSPLDARYDKDGRPKMLSVLDRALELQQARALALSRRAAGAVA